MPFGPGTGRKILHTTDDRRRAELPGDAAGTGTLSRVQERFSERVTGCTPANLKRCGERGVGEGG